MTWWQNDPVATDAAPSGAWWQNDPVADPKSLSIGNVAGQAIANLPSSAYNLGASLVHTVAHPIQTAEGLYDIGKGAVSKAEGALGVQQDPAQKAQNEAAINAMGQFFADRYGSMDKFKETLAKDPAGVAMDLSSVLTGGEGVLARLPGAARAADAVGTAARVTNPVNLAGKVASGVVEPLVSTRILGPVTGAGPDAIRQAARAGYDGSQTFTDNLRGNVPMSDTVDMAKSAVDQMGKERGDAYRAGMASVKADPTRLQTGPIQQAVTDAADMVQHNGFIIDNDAANTLNAINKKLVEWHLQPSRTAESLDALKQAIGAIQQSAEPGSLSAKIAGNIYNATKAQIVKQAPTYAKTMSDYSDASDAIKEAQRTLSLGQKASEDTALRKLQSVMRNNVSTNYGNRAKLVDQLAQYEPELPNAIAGQALNSLAPRGLAGYGTLAVGGNGLAFHGLPALTNPATAAMLAAAGIISSPRLVGEGAYAAGRVGNALAPVANALPGAAKTAYVSNALTGGIGPRYDVNGNLISQ